MSNEQEFDKNLINNKNNSEQNLKFKNDYNFIYRMKKEKNKKQRKQEMKQKAYEELKSKVLYPELFEEEDVASEDTFFLNIIKATPHSVPVPKCWKSNTGKIFPDGFSKPAYTIPFAIRETGIPKVREILREEEESLSLRAKIKKKLYPKPGKIPIDFNFIKEKLKIKERPKFLKYSEIFLPNWNYEIKKCEPGYPSVELMDALGIDNKTPYPWIFKMQKCGLPPSYPDKKIPGLNHPIPDGCSYGYQPMGWGHPIIKLEDEVQNKEKQVKLTVNQKNQYTEPIYTEIYEDTIYEEKVDVISDDKEEKTYEDKVDVLSDDKEDTIYEEKVNVLSDDKEEKIYEDKIDSLGDKEKTNYQKSVEAKGVKKSNKEKKKEKIYKNIRF